MGGAAARLAATLRRHHVAQVLHREGQRAMFNVHLATAFVFVGSSGSDVDKAGGGQRALGTWG